MHAMDSLRKWSKSKNLNCLSPDVKRQDYVLQIYKDGIE